MINNPNYQYVKLYEKRLLFLSNVIADNDPYDNLLICPFWIGTWDNFKLTGKYKAEIRELISDWVKLPS